MSSNIDDLDGLENLRSINENISSKDYRMRMSRIPTFIAVGALAFVAATAVAEASAAIEVRTTMKEHVNPAMLAIWDVTNEAMNDDGALDSSKLDAAKWDSLANYATDLAEAGKAMAAAQTITAASAADQSVGDGEVTMAHVQHQIDADPAGFRAKASDFAEHSAKLLAAVKAHDAETTGTLVGDMDAVCEACHATYWYGE